MKKIINAFIAVDFHLVFCCCFVLRFLYYYYFIGLGQLDIYAYMQMVNADGIKEPRMDNKKKGSLESK